MHNVRDRLLSVCLERHEGRFASGQKANNKLDLEKLANDPELEQFVVESLAGRVLEHAPEFVVGIPDGATQLAGKVAVNSGLYLAHLKKNDQDPNKFEFASWADEEAICEPLNRGVLIEDVFNRFTNTRRALAIPLLAKRIVAVEAIWDRGLPAYREQLDIPCGSIISEHIPDQLPDDSDLWMHMVKS
jgi:hypothetical protein